MKHPCSRPLVGYDLWEVTASGMNSYYDTYFRWLDRALRLAPDSYNSHQDRVFRQNYGGIDVRWNTTHLNSSEILLSLYSEEAVPLMQRRLSLSDFYSAHPSKSHEIDRECLLKRSILNRNVRKIASNLAKGEVWQIVGLSIIAVGLLLGWLLSRGVFRLMKRLVK